LTTDIGAGRRSTFPLHRSKMTKGLKTMVASMMKGFDRFALSFFLVLAATPVLALAAVGTIR
jgi:hypothetical protein